MKSIKIVIFDCDGVMFDTGKANRAYYNQILSHFGKPHMTPEQFVYSQMHTAEGALSYLFANDGSQLEAAQAYRKTMTYEPFFKKMEIEPYLKPLLQHLRPQHKTAVATNRSDTMDRVLSEFDLEKDFDLVVTALDVEHPKPHPEPLLKVLEYFKLKPEEAIYVGDSELDEISAKASEIPLAAYKNSSLNAAFHITSLKEIERIIAG